MIKKKKFVANNNKLKNACCYLGCVTCIVDSFRIKYGNTESLGEINGNRHNTDSQTDTLKFSGWYEDDNNNNMWSVTFLGNGWNQINVY